jgi:hypothetical protein
MLYEFCNKGLRSAEINLNHAKNREAMKYSRLNVWLTACIAASLFSGLWGTGSTAIAAEYQGKNIDGRRFRGQVYSYETGGVFQVEVEFRKKKATLYFVNGSQQTVRLKRSEILNPKAIEGWSQGFFTIGDIFSVGVADNSSDNLQPPRPRPFEGFWRISLHETDLQ